MAAVLAFGLAGIHLKKLGSFTYQEICMARGMKDDLKKLHQTTLLLKDKLLDAAKQQER
ncbi:hypothetical protein TIFTF001_005805 [Ficus carica]|uniref:Uncharacterized protein n=1 Tax=Ficus carica TaxID=3494 RepID=A0AA88CZ33_FICCA|nr:hypothetical protein TIFTF001_005805 [Ficus carica]